jgi:hypothetical protein
LSDYDQAQVGNVVLPLTPVLSNPLLKDADPALAAVFDFFTWLVSHHIGPRWDAEVVALDRTDLVGRIVSITKSIDPTFYFQQEQDIPPILAMYRQTTQFVERTRHYSQKISTWGFDWILPPLTPGEAERLLHLRNAVEDLFLERIDRGFDPNYQSGAQVFKNAGITGFKLAGPGEHIRLTPQSSPQLSMTFEELHLHFEVREQVRAIDNFPAMQGATFSVSSSNADGTTYPDLSQGQVNNP